MRRQNFILVFVVIFLLSSIPNYAQDEASKKTTKIGIGVTISDIKDLFQSIMGDGNAAPSIYIPIDISPAFRIEPEISYYKFSEKEEYNSSTDENRITSYSIGLGLSSMNRRGSVNLFYGARFGMIKASSVNEYTYIGGADKDEETGSGFYIAPTIGGEYFFSENFAMGGEVQIKYSSTKWEGENGGDEGVKRSVLSTRALFSVRFYF